MTEDFERIKFSSFFFYYCLPMRMKNMLIVYSIQKMKEKFISAIASLTADLFDTVCLKMSVCFYLIMNERCLEKLLYILILIASISSNSEITIILLERTATKSSCST